MSVCHHQPSDDFSLCFWPIMIIYTYPIKFCACQTTTGTSRTATATITATSSTRSQAVHGAGGWNVNQFQFGWPCQESKAVLEYDEVV